MKKTTVVYLLGIVSFVLLIFNNWIFSAQIIGGDWPYFYPESIKTFGYLPPSWSSVQGNGFGGPVLVYALDSYLYFTGWLFSNVLHIPWEIVYKIFWFGMFLLLCTFSMHRLLEQQFPKMPLLFRLIGVVFYFTNTFILLVVGGGQMGVALGYAMIPLVLSAFIKLIQAGFLGSNLLLPSLLAGIVLAVQVLFDIRMAYITLVGGVIFTLVYLFIYLNKTNRNVLLKLLLYAFIIPLFIIGILHAFWILPFLFTGKTSVSQLGSAYTSAESVRFFSFARFENAAGLLQPNWPENIFGKVSFMKAEFLLLPILAFLSLVFVSFKKQKASKESFINLSILFFSLLALVGIFLAKGANEPFGDVYIWLFDTVPGFIMFRDPIKWYSLIVVSYCVLLPYSIWNIYMYLKSKDLLKIKMNILKLQNIFIILVTAFLLSLIHPAIIGDLSGTFSRHTVPGDYIALKDTITGDENFYRTLWVPRMQRFAYTDKYHPSVEASALFNATNSAELVRAFNGKGAEGKLQNLSIRYVVIPHDPKGEIFIKDRKYNAVERAQLKKELDAITWLKKVEKFKELSVYEVSNPKGKVWIKDGESVRYNRMSDSQLIIQNITKTPTTIVFSESYSPYWELHNGNQTLKSEKYLNLNSFTIPKADDNSEYVIQYSLEGYYSLGKLISVIAVFSLIIVIIVIKKREIRK